MFIVFAGSVLSIGVVWPLADIFNGLMAIPNLIGVVFLAKVVAKESDDFAHVIKQEKLAALS